MNFLIRILIIAAVSFGLAHVLTGIHVDSFWTAVVFAVVLAILNTFVKPILIILTLPVTIITLGLFLFIINALVVLLASRFVKGFTIANFWWGLLFSLILSFITAFVNRELERKNRTTPF